METGKFYFYTATILNWIDAMVGDAPKQIIIDSFQYLVVNRCVRIAAFVIMPNHIHILWQPLQNKLQLRFMKFTGQKLKFYLLDNRSDILDQFVVNDADRQFQIWQRNSLPIELFSNEFTEQKLDYIHNNPCQGKWMLANDPMGYAYSSIQFYESGESEYEFLTHYKDILG